MRAPLSGNHAAKVRAPLPRPCAAIVMTSRISGRPLTPSICPALVKLTRASAGGGDCQPSQDVCYPKHCARRIVSAMRAGWQSAWRHGESQGAIGDQVTGSARRCMRTTGVLCSLDQLDVAGASGFQRCSAPSVPMGFCGARESIGPKRRSYFGWAPSHVVALGGVEPGPRHALTATVIKPAWPCPGKGRYGI